MSENTSPKIKFTESPASWNTRYIDPKGFVCQLTIRDDNGKGLLEKASGALSYLLEQGSRPYDYKNNNSKTAWCSIHKATMKQYSKNGKSWYSHKLPNGEWCYGKPKEKEGGIDG